MQYILQPQLTPYCGPYYCYPDKTDTPSRRIAFQHQVTDQLLTYFKGLQLSYFQQNFSPNITDWLPFYWAGYRQTTRYTYLLPDISHPDILFDAFERDQRQKRILHLLPSVHLTDDATPEELATFHTRYWQHRGEQDLLSQTFICHVCRAALARRQGLIFSLKDKDNNTLAMRFVVFDECCAHSLLSALNPDHHVSGATETLIWLALQRLSSLSHSYDFEGSMDPGIEHFYRSFGAQQVPYFSIERCPNPLFRLILKIKR